MKKKKLLRNVSLVALSAVMLSGVALASTACGNKGGNANAISVYIFCNESDEHTNNTICKNWEAEYNRTQNKNIKVNLTVEYQKGNYFNGIKDFLKNGRNGLPDVIYLSPKYVQQYADAGYVADLSKYIVNDDQAVESIGGLWQDSVSIYGYRKNDKNYKLGQQIVYRENGAEGAGYYTADGSQSVGIFGLPKDYSNFAMGYNKKYFSDTMKERYTTTLGSTARNVKSSSEIAKSGSQYVQNYKGYDANDSTNFVATYAAGDQAGQEAPIITIGTPVRYKPFNFYRYNDYQSALKAGDPMAVATNTYTMGRGYTVTIPGFPGDTHNVSEAGNGNVNTENANAPYDSSLVHTVFTYAEYGALVWAVTYYLNTFDWDASDPTQGDGGLVSGNVRRSIYGSEQYEGAQGNALYLLPWLASNDGDFTDVNTTKCTNDGYDAQTAGTVSAIQAAGTDFEKRQKLNLDGTYRNADVQYGLNSANFMETYGAYQEFGSTWNGNSGNAGDQETAKSNVSGWDFFRMGAAVFYGAGTWDAATRNDVTMDVFEFGQMPVPVAEKYALYSQVKGADYTLLTYSNKPDAKQSGDDAVKDGEQRANKSEGLKTYSNEEIVTNQIKRQDKWAARMDSVGYAANGRFADMEESNPEYWKNEATASLIQALTIGEPEQVTLTYAGAQLPNFRQQCTEFLKFQDPAYRNGAFKDMITYEGFADTTDSAEGRRIWDYYYKVACAMAKDSLSGSSKRDLTVAQWISQSGFGDYNGTENGDASKTLRYDPQYGEVKLSAFIGGMDTNISFAMKVLRMVAFTYADRDLNIRAQYGVNSVKDATMFTTEEDWITKLDGGAQAKLLAYINQKSFTNDQMTAGRLNDATVAHKLADQNKATVWTPAVYAAIAATNAQKAFKK